MAKLNNFEITPEWLEKQRKIREQLKQLSDEVKPLVEAGEYETINEAIIDTCYRDAINREFKSYHQWRKEGYFVKLGQKAYPIWSRPKSAIKEEKNQEQGKEEAIHEEDDKVFHIAYVFSNAQVKREEQKGRAAA